MTYLLPIGVDGFETQARGEYTSSFAAAAFNARLEPFVQLLELGTSSDVPDADAIKQLVIDEDYKTLISENLEELIEMAKNGVLEDPLNPNSKKDFFTIEMVASLNELIKSVRAAGGLIDVENGTATLSDENAVNWKNLAVSSEAILQIITIAKAQVEQNRTLQALVELIYVRTGNDILTQNLEELETALSTTKDSLRTLTQLQDLFNRVETTEETQTFEEFASVNYAQDSPTAFMQGSGFVDATGFGLVSMPGIVEQASRHFQQLAPTVDIANLSNADTALFLDLRNQLIQQIAHLSATTIGAGTEEDSGTLLDQLRTVKDSVDRAIGAAEDLDLPTEVDDTGRIKHAMRLWMLDGESPDGIDKISDYTPGEIQRNLTAAITAGQSLNDTQKEEVRRYLFVFEEYYKSAAAILNKITQLLERIAQGIAR